MARDFNTPPLPLEALTLHPRHHRAALWWLGWLYRNPDAFRESLKLLPRWPAVRAVYALYLHALPWLLVLAIMGQLLFFHAGLVHPEWGKLALAEQWFAAAKEAAVGLVLGLVFGLLVVFALGLVGGFVGGFVLGLVSGLVVGLGSILVVGLVVGFVFGPFVGLVGFWRVLVVGLVCGLFGGLSVDLVFGRIGRRGAGLVFVGVLVLVNGLINSFVVLNGFGTSGVLALVNGFGSGVIIGIQFGYYRPYYLGPHVVFWFLRRWPECYRFHPAAWDRLCWTPFPWFDRLLVRYAEANRARMEPEIQRLIREVPGQKKLAAAAWTILRARCAARVGNLKDVSQAIADLPEGERGFLGQTRRVRELAEPIARQQMRIEATTRPYFREIETRNLIGEIRNFQGRISGMKEPIATEFRKAAEAWLKLAEAQQQSAAQATQAEPAPQVFRAGDPLEREREAFVPRFRVLEELEGQVMLGSGCPGILLRGPRRMGKSSLLKNVQGFLPKEVSVVFVSLQSARLFSSLGHFVGGLSQAVAEELSALPALAALKENLRASQPAELAGFLRFLNECNTALELAGQRLVLALDEYEMLDEKLREGVFTKDLLATLRESIQSHRRIIWAFSGNADITELTGADWTSYLISVRTLTVPCFTPEETHLLLTEPLKHSVLRDEDKAKSALFWREFWGSPREIVTQLDRSGSMGDLISRGEDGIRRIHAESGGWPYFAQLIAETAVTLANESPSGGRTLPEPLLEQALDASVERGRNAMIQMVEKQCRAPGEWEYLRGFARRESQPVPEDAEVRRSLNRRQLCVEAGSGEWRLRVPLMGRWLRKEW